jgi:hypothetical protein
VKKDIFRPPQIHCCARKIPSASLRAGFFLRLKSGSAQDDSIATDNVMPMNLLIVVHHRFGLWRVPAWFGERLSQEFPKLQIHQHDSYEGIEEDLREAEILFTLSLRPEQFAVALKYGGFMRHRRRCISFYLPSW